MTISNIMSGFSTTGVYPINRDAVLAKIAPKLVENEQPSVHSNLLFMPMSSPMPRKQRASHSVTFTDKEIKQFEARYENGFDLVSDDRYNQWLTLHHHADASALLDVSVTADSLYIPISPDKVNMPSAPPSV